MDEMDGRVPHIARQVLKVIVSQIEDIQTDGKPLRGAAKNSVMAKCMREQG
jgi:hypothetical protein